jgi:mannitol/fructose-specific phosphotransferase system IIA component (Ntr-type)
MKLAEILRESLVFPELAAANKADALREMIAGISGAYPELPENDLFSVILERERLSSTGIGSGIAIPHAKHPLADRQIAAFGRSRVGIPFDAIDRKPVHLIFLIVGPVGANEAHLKVLARISKFLHDTSFRERLFTAETAALIYEAISEKDAQY